MKQPIQRSTVIRDRPIWFFWGRYWYFGHSWIDNRYFWNF